jgi:hypothetical protein
MGKKYSGWRGWWKSLWEESVATSVATSTTVSETISVAPSVAVSVAPSATVSVDPKPTSSGDSVTLFHPVPTEFIVDEVATEADVALHADVIWCPGVPATFSTDWNPGDWYSIPSQWPDFGLHNIASPGPSSQVESFGIRSCRFHSGYEPGGYTCNDGTEGTEAFCASGGGLNSKPIRNALSNLNFRKWFNSNSDPGGVVPPVCLGSTPITEAWLRWEFYLEQSFMDEFNEPNGFKLGGFMSQIGATSTMWLAAPNATDISNNRFRLATYWSGGDLATDPRWAAQWLGKVIDNVFVPIGEWTCIEQHYKVNTNATTADGIRQVWVNDTLVIDHQDCFNHKYTGSAPLEIWGVWNQWFHGGDDFAPTGPQWARFAGYTVASRRIGRIKANR